MRYEMAHLHEKHGRKIFELLKNAVSSANLEVYDIARKNEELKGMGTTVTVALIKDKTAIYAHVGDSRIYLVNDQIKQLTKDHSIVQSLIESGKITPEDASVHPRKNVKTRALGVEEQVIADFGLMFLHDGDTLMLCTDGLTNFVSEDIILDTFNKYDKSEVCDKLIDLANDGGGGDNITVVTLTLE